MISGRGILVHEWIAKAGGSENVLEAMSRLYPAADILCLWNDSSGRFATDRLNETWLARSPLRRNKLAALPFMMPTWRRQRDHCYDWALISSHLFAHHARFRPVRPGFRRFVYVHTPARYIWTPEMDGRGRSVTARAVASLLKRADRRIAQQTIDFAANSAFIRERMRRCWGVDAVVVHPPVEVEAIQAVADWRSALDGPDSAILDGLPTEFVLGASRFVAYKRLDRVIWAAEVAGLPAVLAGRGPEIGRLRSLAAEANVPVHIVEAPSTPLLRALYQSCSVFAFPAVEDFGIMPVEAMAAGAVVIAQSVGGTAEIVEPGVTGALTTFASTSELREALAIAAGTQREDRLVRAKQFSVERFQQSLSDWMSSTR